MFRQANDILRNNSGIAFYRQISEILQQKIEGGEYRPGSQLPTEAVIGRQFGVNRHTAREALKKLKDDGVVYSIKGKGNFVAQHSKIRYRISQKMRFSSSILEAGFVPGTELLQLCQQGADEELARQLGLKAGDEVLALTLLRSANGTPLMVCNTWLPKGRFPSLETYLVGSFSLYGLMKEHFDLTIMRHQSLFEAVMPEEADVRHLQIPRSVPLLKVSSTARDQFGNTVEYCETRMRGDIGSMVIDF